MKTHYSKEQLETLLREEKFPYHRVELPFGLHTPGQDRSATRDAIYPASLAGKTVLDVGCALGYFSFEAEKKGAARVVGVELKDNRFRQALLLKEALGSEVEFLQRDVLKETFTETFDYVCFLNVIHHLPEPVHALRRLAAITRERLIIEFPTLLDPKFRKNTGLRFAWLLNRFPLIGVSSMSGKSKSDQTFVFTPSAIRRMLQDHAPLFSEIRFVPSPMGGGRQIAICIK